jgi:hypothetical protein
MSENVLHNEHQVRAELLNKELARIQEALKAPKKFKSQNYTFRNCEQILAAVKPLLNGLTIVLSDEVVSIGTSNYVKSTARLSDGVVGCNAVAYAKEESGVIKGGQLTGATSSYARKYALCGLFAIDSGSKDLDAIHRTKPEEPLYVNVPASEDLIRTIKDSGADMDAIYKYYKTNVLTEKQALQIIDRLKTKGAKRV